MKRYVGNIQFRTPLDGMMYKKSEALGHIARTLKTSAERAAMIKYMVDEEFLPCSIKTLYDLVRRAEEDGVPIGDDEWSDKCRHGKKVVFTSTDDIFVSPEVQVQDYWEHKNVSCDTALRV